MERTKVVKEHFTNPVSDKDFKNILKLLGKPVNSKYNLRLAREGDRTAMIYGKMPEALF